jgi:hypothetical protein
VELRGTRLPERVSRGKFHGVDRDGGGKRRRETIRWKVSHEAMKITKQDRIRRLYP